MQQRMMWALVAHGSIWRNAAEQENVALRNGAVLKCSSFADFILCRNQNIALACDQSAIDDACGIRGYCVLALNFWK
jgi:hypothetical protein